ncbi:MAG: BlaI/MecI/CopY family transcriptional regulator [Bryobacterales bacterium]|nr:BlaI/MecI/CopY family transcriptional regulator [Bryobacterales bacterium]
MKQAELGHLESTLMEILWRKGELSVKELAELLDRPLAYTTVMTTLDRLYKKGLLQRRKCDRAFFYSPKLTFRDWIRRRAADLVRALRAGAPEEVVASSLVDAIGKHDRALLDELERQIRARRKQQKEQA